MKASCKFGQLTLSSLLAQLVNGLVSDFSLFFFCSLVSSSRLFSAAEASSQSFFVSAGNFGEPAASSKLFKDVILRGFFTGQTELSTTPRVA